MFSKKVDIYNNRAQTLTSTLRGTLDDKIRLNVEVGGTEFAKILAEKMHGYRGTVEQLCQRIGEEFEIDLKNREVRYGLYCTLRCFLQDGILMSSIEANGTGECPVKAVFFFLNVYE